MLTDADKTEAKLTLATLLDENEPEALVASIRLMCERKTGDPFIGESERHRWRRAAAALSEVLAELEHTRPDAEPKAE